MELEPAEDLVARQKAANEHSMQLAEQLSTNLLVLADLLKSMAVELALARERIADLESSLESSRRIAMAIGIVMNQFKVNEKEALDRIVKISQTTDRKVLVVVDDIVQSGEISAA